MRRLSRRTLAGGLAALPAILRSGDALAGLQPVTVVCPNGTEISGIDILNAKAGGHFAAQGLDATVIGSGTGVGVMQQLVAGRCQFLRAGALELLKASARQDVKLVAIAELEHAVTYVMVSSAGRPIRDPALLRGKRVGVFAVNTTIDNFLDLMLYHANVPPDTVERQAIGANPGSFALVRMGRLDAVILPYEMAWPLLHPASDTVALSVGDVVAMPGRCYLTTRAIAEQQPELAQAFTRAMAASVLEIAAGPVEPLVARAEAAFEMTMQRPMAESAAILHWMVRNWMANGRANLLRNDATAWQAGAAEMAATGIASVASVGELFTNRFVSEALPP